ncbi:MAG: amidohydrolase, partial [Chloroflexi bacterium]|nr:amidohydrolase [Chloroflexota bacterium]
WRRDFHQHPEVGFQEYRTAGRVAETLRALGLSVQTEVGKTGVVGVLGSGKPVIGLRADMDALPIQEANDDINYASQHPNVMHACGHDAHTAILLGVAQMLSAMPERPAGELRFFFQPCEETEDDEGHSGAELMVEAGALDGVDHVIALHVGSDLPAGKVVINDGSITAAVDTFYATITGTGCHGAYPQRGVDPIYILAQVINAIHGIRARRIDPVRPALISVGSVHGGDTDNVIPNEVQLTGTMRSYDDATRDQLAVELHQAFGVARALGGDYQLRIQRGCPSVFNDAQVAATIRAVARDLLGPDGLLDSPPGMGGEDFSFMTRKAPGAMFLLGAQYDEISRPHHSPIFNIDESSFAVGAAVLAETALRLLKDR